MLLFSMIKNKKCDINQKSDIYNRYENYVMITMEINEIHDMWELEEMRMWSVVGTWPFSLQLSEKAAQMLANGAKALDALEAGVHLVESDPNVDSVGRGGYLNANGDLELDAAVMDGDTLKMGCVEHPALVATFRAVTFTNPSFRVISKAVSNISCIVMVSFLAISYLSSLNIRLIVTLVILPFST